MRHAACNGYRGDMFCPSEGLDSVRRGRFKGLLGGLALLMTLAASRPALAIELAAAVLENRRCFNCHGQEHIGELLSAERSAMVQGNGAPASPAAEGPRPALYLAPAALIDSVHAQLACIECHQTARTLPHAPTLEKVDCGRCHQQAESMVAQGVHASALALNDPLAPSCVSCHGDHDIRPRSDRTSRVHPLNIVKVCGDCHQQHKSANGESEAKHVANYLESVHGRALTRGGLVVAATCADCHESHQILPSSDPRSTVHRTNVSQTCGQCHVGIAEVYATSIHGQKLAEEARNAPTCTDCHTAHGISLTNTPGFVLDIVNECGHCHDKPPRGSTSKRSLYDTYRKSYHGQVNQLGSTRAARCSDCHGAHDILPTSDPNSRLHADHRVQTCAQCHAGATPRFAEFHAHADYRDRERFPLLYGVWLYFIIVMSSAFGFFGLHSVLWFIRSAIERARHGPHPRFKANPHGIVRFSLVDRINHGLLIVSFFGLTLTGMPLFFSDQRWAMALTNFFGGPHVCGLIHRFLAIMLMGNVIVHAIGIYHRFKARKESAWRWFTGPNSMAPRWKDVTDCLGMIRWFFLGGAKPRFDRWTYWEKFDYWAEIFGTGIIGGSGLLLWFPTFFAKFLPGWIFNVAMIVHGYEALLAVGFIFTIHFFNAHLRMEKFPVDDVMFTGQLPEEEFKHERGEEYARLESEGKLAALRVPPAAPWMRPLAVIVGILAMAIGMTLVTLIILAGLGVL